jgi:hypothetical protein
MPSALGQYCLPVVVRVQELSHPVHTIAEIVGFDSSKPTRVDNQSRERRLEFGRRAACEPVTLLKRVVSLNAVADCGPGIEKPATRTGCA